ncbi:hypothetical protein I4U23_000906 [Adineta vaga]|nr:hypothetical protein I4U23_000906 [Adineta vaga]
MQVATFAGGCFWRMQSIFSKVPGVVGTVVGYAGGHVANPTYQQVRTGQTGHAETLQITFNPQAVSYMTLLQVFFSSHDSSQLNRQGADVGTNYRSIIFYHDMSQAQSATQYIDYLRTSRGIPVVTHVVPYQAFYPAEAYHQYFEARQQQYLRTY